MNPIEQHQQAVAESIEALGRDEELQALSHDWLRRIAEHRYTHNFEWMGRPIIQVPQDIVAMQELIWSIKPDLIIETGIAHGGSLIFSASMLALLDLCEAQEQGVMLDPSRSSRKVIGIDIDIRPHNRAAIEAHPMASRIHMFEGSSIAPEIVAQVKEAAKGYQRILVCLDSNHTHDHVLAELNAYAPLVSPQSYCVVFDTAIEEMPDEMFGDRPWGVGNSPKSAVYQFLSASKEFDIDKRIDHKLLTSVAPDGYLKRVQKE